MAPKKLFALLLLSAVIIGALLTTSCVSAREGADNPIFAGKMEFIPAQGNHLGDVISLRVKVSYNRNLVDFDSHQILQALGSILPKFFQVRDIRYKFQKEGNLIITELWEFRVQFLDGLPPLTMEIPSFTLQYKKKDDRHFSSFEIAAASVSFDALTSEDASPDPVIKNLTFGPDANIKAIILFSLSAVLILAAAWFGINFFLRKQKDKRKVPEPEPIDEFLAKYNSLRSSFNRGEDGLVVLHRLYLLLLSFYTERRGVAPKIGWQERLPEEERVVIRAFQKLYGESAVSKFQAQQLLDGAKKILEK